jgi:predicted Zn-dependent peptidase
MLLPLLTALALADSLPAPLATSAGTAGGATFIVHSQPALPMVALRLAVLADDPPGYAGAGHLVQHLVLPSMREQLDRVGGRVEVERSADAVVYTVTGPSRELPVLSQALLTALRPAEPTAGQRVRAARALAEERLAEWENAEEHAKSALRARLFPDDVSAAGTERSAVRLDSTAVRSVWGAMYRPERVSVLAVGNVSLSQVEAAFADLPEGGPALEEGADTVSLAPLAPALATRGWIATGWLAMDEDPATLSVAARLLGDELRRRVPDATVTAEHWWSHHGQALVLLASAPSTQLTATRRAIGTLASSLAGDLGDARVREAARALRRDMLFYSRTPERMAEVIGRFADRGGDAEAAQAFYAALEEVDADAVRALLRHLVDQTPTRVEIAPQKLNPNG